MSETAVVTQPSNGSAEAHYEARRLVKMKELKSAVAGLTSERDTARAERDKAVKELETVKSKSDSSALHKANVELQQKLRVLEHRKVLDAIAVEKGLNPTAVDAFYKLSEYQAEGDEVDVAELGAFVDAKKTEHPYLFAAPTDGTPAPLRKPAPGLGQGKPGKKAGDTSDMDILREGDPRLNDAAWIMKNQDKVVASAQERLRRGELDGWMEGDKGIDGRGAHGQTLTV